MSGKSPLGVRITRPLAKRTGSLRLGTRSGRVLEKAFGAGVVDELVAADQPFLHGNAAPGTEAIRYHCHLWVNSMDVLFLSLERHGD
ncbi:MAG: hypothetical protein H8K04_19615 [Nitrospira sp.]